MILLFYKNYEANNKIELQIAIILMKINIKYEYKLNTKV